MANGMATNNITYTPIQGLPDEVLLNLMVIFYEIIFEDADVDFFTERIREHDKLFSILAFEDQTLVGFKIGYPYNETTFYSWIGGVSLEYRRQKIGTKLTELQEQYAINSGFKQLRTKSMNTYKPMMILNLKNGFDITKYYTNAKGQNKIVFEKKLL